MNSLKKAAVVGAMMSAVLIVSGTAASAGICDSGKLCIYQNDNGGGGLYKTVNRSISHDNLKFDNGATVKNGANSVRNRISCTIRVIDDRGIYPDDWQDFSGNATKAINLISSVDNENDRHERRC